MLGTRAPGVDYDEPLGASMMTVAIRDAPRHRLQESNVLAAIRRRPWVPRCRAAARTRSGQNEVALFSSCSRGGAPRRGSSGAGGSHHSEWARACRLRERRSLTVRRALPIRSPRHPPITTRMSIGAGEGVR